MADISKITLPNGNTYNIKDSWARDQIETLEAIDNGVRLVGVTTTTLTDNATTATISINDSDHIATKGDLVFSENKEFLFDGNKWHLLDEISTHGILASKNKVKYDKVTNIDFTDTDSNKRITLDGVDSTVNITITDSADGNYQPKGTISQPIFSNGSVAASGTITPTGTISKLNFIGTKTTGLTVSAVTSGTSTYTPEGTVSAPIISIATAGATNNTLKPVTAKTVVSTLVTAAPNTAVPENAITYYSVSNETLSLYQIGATKTDSVTLGDAVTVKTGDATYTANTPTFIGTGKRLVLQDYTPIGDISQPIFTGEETTIDIVGTASGTISQPVFTGTKTQFTGSTIANGSVILPTISFDYNTTEAIYE